MKATESLVSHSNVFVEKGFGEGWIEESHTCKTLTAHEGTSGSTAILVVESHIPPDTKVRIENEQYQSNKD